MNQLSNGVDASQILTGMRKAWYWWVRRRRMTSLKLVTRFTAWPLRQLILSSTMMHSSNFSTSIGTCGPPSGPLGIKGRLISREGSTLHGTVRVHQNYSSTTQILHRCRLSRVYSHKIGESISQNIRMTIIRWTISMKRSEILLHKWESGAAITRYKTTKCLVLVCYKTNKMKKTWLSWDTSIKSFNQCSKLEWLMFLSQIWTSNTPMMTQFQITSKS